MQMAMPSAYEILSIHTYTTSLLRPEGHLGIIHSYDSCHFLLWTVVIFSLIESSSRGCIHSPFHFQSFPYNTILIFLFQQSHAMHLIN